MSLLNDLLFIVRKNLESKQVEEEQISCMLEKIRQKYQNDIDWNDIKPPKFTTTEVPRDELLDKWQEYYMIHGEQTGEWVFEPITNSLNDKFEYGRTLLHTAVLKKNIVEIKQLIQKGVKTDIKDNSGLTPFQVAIIEQDRKIISLFEELGITC